MQLINTLDYIIDKEATFDEEDSFHFLKDYQLHTDWHIYSSKDYPLETVKQIANTFCYSHGVIPIVENKDSLINNYNTFWSSVPLGLFRYKMLDDGSWFSCSFLKKQPGFIVEGIYWLNGFAYQVRNQKFILEVNLFIDQETKTKYNYPDAL